MFGGERRGWGELRDEAGVGEVGVVIVKVSKDGLGFEPRWSCGGIEVVLVTRVGVLVIEALAWVDVDVFGDLE